jgi:hypothetical protein
MDAARSGILAAQSLCGAWAVCREENVFETANALLSLAELDGIDPDVLPSFQWILGRQRDDGSWDASAQLRIPSQHGDAARVAIDSNRIFTTATALDAISTALQKMHLPR